MKNNHFLPEVILALIIIVLLGLFLNPFQMGMPDEMHMMLNLFFVVAFSVFAGFIWKEKARDERESYLRMTADRIGYILGAATLVVAIAIQYFFHMVDPWLVGTLGVMVLAKLVALIYGRIRL